MLSDGFLVLVLDLRGLTLLLLLWQVISVRSASPLYHLACDIKLCGVGACAHPHSLGAAVPAQGCKQMLAGSQGAGFRLMVVVAVCWSARLCATAVI